MGDSHNRAADRIIPLPGDSPAILAVPERADEFLALVLDTGGNLSDACRRAGMSRVALYRHRERDPEFGRRLQQALAFASQDRATRLGFKVDQHIEMHLDGGWEYKRDGDGNYVLDDGFERIKVSTIPLRDLNGTRREMRSALEPPSSPVTNVVSINSTPHVTERTHKVVLVDPDGNRIDAGGAEDAECEELDHG
ncbi:hypothetical protein P2H44_03375 [Albimonas sp. CAU 1670]|uniref:hypothetical protein n=1 Tax=Albimonas sp. CAU 1670 TaxID=3032599 RepID=UPI0023DADA4A|nr:hypothetical protein [Albimonas sp. CAU 1670]MDF2231585.1 hypothetical protein [Albimonas sp. CAU 1670]